MEGSDRKAQVVATFVSDALSRALFERLGSKERETVILQALARLPSEPDATQDPSLHAAWKSARAELTKLVPSDESRARSPSGFQGTKR
jgi:hypothetical protein